jgi:heme A synthase
MVSVFALAVWVSEPSKPLRWFGLGAILVLLVGYGEFHRGMMKAEAARKEQKSLAEIPLPVPQGVLTVVGLALCAGACAAAVAGGAFGRWARVTAVVALVAVMIQGLLGGFRVFLDALYGTQLAAYHGTFGQVTFAVIVSAVMLCGPRRFGDALPASDRRRLGTMAVALPAAVFVQLVWGVWVRHTGSPVAQRLHVLTAFVVTGLAVWLAVRSLATPAGRRQLGFTTYHLLGILAVQVLLGVEAWMLKFGTSGPQGLKLPELRDVTVMSAGVRTLHVVIGTSLLAAAAVMALRVRRVPLDGREPAAEAFGESTVRLGEPVSAS